MLCIGARPWPLVDFSRVVSHAQDAHDFFKPHLASEFPVVDVEAKFPVPTSKISPQIPQIDNGRLKV